MGFHGNVTAVRRTADKNLSIKRKFFGLHTREIVTLRIKTSDAVKNVVVIVDSAMEEECYVPKAFAESAPENPALSKHLMRNALVTNLVCLRG